jgi:RNA polymerase sigma factor (sigma-70 family)
MANGQGHLVLRHVRAILAAHDADQLSDRQLLSRFHGQNDQAAFTALVRRHGPMVLAVCRRVLPNAHDADDAFQAAFFTLARRAGAGTWHESLGPWLHLVAHRLALRIQAETQRRSRHESQATSRSPDDPLATITGRELCAVIDAELSALPERLRAPLVLCCLEGKTRDEASRHLGWSLSTLKRRLDQGRERLRWQLQRRGFALPAALAGLLAIEETQAALPAALIHQSAVLASAGMFASGRVALLSEEILKCTLLAKGKSWRACCWPCALHWLERASS